MVALAPLAPMKKIPLLGLRPNRGRWPRQLLWPSTAALLIVAALLQVHQLSQTTRAGYEMNELNRVRAASQAENYELEARIAQLSSLARVDLEARTRLGLVPAERRLYLTLNQPLPEGQTVPRRFLTEPS